MVETTDPPEHTPLRARIGEAFRGREVGAGEDSPRELVTQLIDPFIERGECDLIPVTFTPAHRQA